jgi:hypothetical protein
MAVPVALDPPAAARTAEAVRPALPEEVLPGGTVAVESLPQLDSPGTGSDSGPIRHAEHTLGRQSEPPREAGLPVSPRRKAHGGRVPYSTVECSAPRPPDSVDFAVVGMIKDMGDALGACATCRFTPHVQALDGERRRAPPGRGRGSVPGAACAMAWVWLGHEGSRPKPRSVTTA